MDVAARLEAVLEENERLRGRVDELEAALGVTFVAPLGWGLTPRESALLGVLLKRDLVTKDSAMAALYRDLGKDEPELKIIDVFVCKMRAKLRPLGLKIHTVWGQGYRLDPASKALILAELGEAA